jgi:predicted dinucleotide-binding enzyme
MNVYRGCSGSTNRLREISMKIRDTGRSRRDILGAVGATALLGGLPFAAPVVFAQNTKPKIGLIGSGNVGSALGRSWARAGYDVMFSSRNLDNNRALAAEVGSRARAGTVQEAAAFGDVVLLAVPYGALPALGATLGDALRGKVVLDASNPFPDRDGEIATEAREKGAGLMSAELLPGARIVRAFNAIGAARMGSAWEEPGRIGMPIASDDSEAIEIASQLIRDLGYEPVLVGGLAMGRYLLPGTPLSGEHTPDEIRTIASSLEP